MTFKSYHAKLDGAVVLVINRNDNAHLKTGEPVAALKIRPRFQVGWKGWSGGAYPAYSYGPPQWVRASRVA